MSPELEALGMRAVACKGWRWMPGMLLHDIGTSRIGRVHKSGRDWVVFFGLTSEARLRRDTTGIGLSPDLNDPATLGCLLALVREANSRPYATAQYCGGYWQVEDPKDDRWDTDRGFGPWATEAEALVAALEAAP